ncbi:predicted protein [Histoplasma capsulatum G186AR]|uniref:Uncharacterized protein n=1 Tax=Ajellomyces capsulatus (strain G186AR / H82 / ATCC MYA-2454 / RMSCC 2432) TaxID=447093 RepID=C0NQ90_AJECG|nr:uncharacterized protein HCBG_05678 [Histoplasma capsulatum G186AR]EEH06362.1 predicted protein [Histoplasma capsulatum G186AR]
MAEGTDQETRCLTEAYPSASPPLNISAGGRPALRGMPVNPHRVAVISYWYPSSRETAAPRNPPGRLDDRAPKLFNDIRQHHTQPERRLTCITCITLHYDAVETAPS